MLRLVLGKLYDSAALLPAKIDARLRQIAAIVNGGLSFDSLAPGTKFAAGQFLEQGHLVPISVQLPGVHPLAQNRPGMGISVAVPAAGELVGVESWLADAGVAHPFLLYCTRNPLGPDIELREVTVENRPAVTKPPAAAGLLPLYYDRWIPTPPVACLAGDRFWAESEFATYAAGIVVFWFRFDHEA